MRSIIQRSQARDFYDIWYLLEIHEMEIDIHLAAFRTKCENKNIDPTGFYSKLEQRLPQYKGRWKSSMVDQVQNLPDFDEVVRRVMRHLKKINLTL